VSEASPLERLVMPVAVAVVRPFIEEHHYSKSINGCKVSMAFALYEAGEMVGAVLFDNHTEPMPRSPRHHCRNRQRHQLGVQVNPARPLPQQPKHRADLGQNRHLKPRLTASTCIPWVGSLVLLHSIVGGTRFRVGSYKVRPAVGRHRLGRE
jgi:hypothetical protein